MQESWRNFIKMGIVHFMAFPDTIKGEGPILETLTKVAEDDFFEVVEITHIKDSSVRLKATNLLESSGLEVYYGAQPVLLLGKYNLNDSISNDEREKAVNRIERCVGEARFLGARGLAVLSGPDYALETLRSPAETLLVESLGRICDCAGKDLGVTLEIFDRDIDKKCLVGPAPLAVQIAEEVKGAGYDNFGLMYDLSHVPLLKEDPMESLAILREHLVHIHIGNCVIKNRRHKLYGDQHPPFCIGGGENGVEELRYFLKALFACGYLVRGKRAVVSFEVKPLSGQKPEVVIAQSKRVFEEAWRRLEI